MEWYDAVNKTFIKGVAVRYLQNINFEPFSIFPRVPTTKKTGYIAKYNKEDWMRIGDINSYKRIGATQSVGDDYSVDKQLYFLDNISFHKDITRTDIEEEETPYDAVTDAVAFVINRIKLVVVANFVNSCLASGIWANEFAGTTDFTKWSDAAATPIKDILGYKSQIKSVTGYEPNRMIVTPDVYTALRTSADIKDQLKVTTDKIVTSAALRNLFDVESFEVLSTVETTAKKGQKATKTNTGFMAAGKVFLGYAPNRASKNEPSAGYHISKGKNIGGMVPIERIPMPQNNHALRLEGNAELAPIIVADDLGCLLTDVV